MNDFTLEELSILLDAADECLGKCFGRELFAKILYMIDNYCEHENTKEVPANSVIICTKCYKVVEE